MCNLSKGVEERSEQRVTLKHIYSVMDSLKVPAEQAMTILRIPESEHKKYQDLLKQ